MLKRTGRRRRLLEQAWKHETNQLANVQETLAKLYWQLEDTIDERLVDSIIYEIKSQEAKYDYHYQNIRLLEEQTNINA